MPFSFDKYVRKKIIHETMPAPSTRRTSFPSGHTTGILSAKLAYFLMNKVWKKKNQVEKTDPGVIEKKMQSEFPEICFQKT